MIKCHRCKAAGYCQCCDSQDTRCVPASVEGLCCCCAEGRCYKGDDCSGKQSKASCSDPRAER